MAMLKLRDGRELAVKETVAKIDEGPDGIKELIAAASNGMIEVTEVRRTVKRKFPTPVDTKAEFLEQEIKHLVAVASIMDLQPTAAEAKLAPVHDRRQAEMPAVSGPFKHDYERHVFACEDQPMEVFQGEARRVQAPVVEAHDETTEIEEIEQAVKTALEANKNKELH